MPACSSIVINGPHHRAAKTFRICVFNLHSDSVFVVVCDPKVFPGDLLDHSFLYEGWLEISILDSLADFSIGIMNGPNTSFF
jgi:hypothetical protein